MSELRLNQLKFGCPMWSHAKWKAHLFSHKAQPDLQQYGQWFNSVEGNTSFYRLPEKTSLSQWADLVPEDFRFTFKFPQQISHQGNLLSEPEMLRESLNRFSLLEQKLGCIMLQLPASFGPSRLDELAQFLSSLPSDFNYAVEVRHLDLFNKGEQERRLNRLLHEHQVNRVIMDTRALFACKWEDDPLVKEVQSKKPKVPTNVVVTEQMPIVRYVGHPVLEQNAPFIQPWINKLHQWLLQGLQPYLFFHMPDNAQAPWLAEYFFQQYQKQYPEVDLPMPSLPAYETPQLSIF